MDDADHHRRLARPFEPPPGAHNRAALNEDRRKSRGARVALADRVGGDQAEDTTFAQQTKCSAKEMRDDIGIAMRSLMQRLQPGQIVPSLASDDRVFAGDGRVADDRVEAATLPCKHLREFHRPMERRNGIFAVAEFRCEGRDGVDPQRRRAGVSSRWPPPTGFSSRFAVLATSATAQRSTFSCHHPGRITVLVTPASAFSPWQESYTPRKSSRCGYFGRVVSANITNTLTLGGEHGKEQSYLCYGVRYTATALASTAVTSAPLDRRSAVEIVAPHRFWMCAMSATGSANRRFHLVLIKPSHYDDDGYVISWWRSSIPSNSLSVVYTLAEDAARRRALGPDVDLHITAIDETNTRIKVDDIAALIRRHDGFGMIGLVGVQSNQFPRALDLARPLRAAGIINQSINIPTFFS
jgi:hypothetical protein